MQLGSFFNSYYFPGSELIGVLWKPHADQGEPRPANYLRGLHVSSEEDEKRCAGPYRTQQSKLKFHSSDANQHRAGWPRQM